MEQPINSVLRHGVSVVTDSLFASSNNNNSDDISEPIVDDVVSDNEDNTDELTKYMSEPSQLTTENNNTISLQFTKEHETKIQEHDDAIQKLSRTSPLPKLDISYFIYFNIQCIYVLLMIIYMDMYACIDRGSVYRSVATGTSIHVHTCMRGPALEPEAGLCRRGSHA